MNELRRERLRHAVRFFYDLQKLRIQTSNRSTTETVELDKADQTFLDATGSTLKGLEKNALKEVQRWLKGVEIYERFLKDQKGCGPTMSGVIISEVAMCRPVSPEELNGATIGKPFMMHDFEYFHVTYSFKKEARDDEKAETVERRLLCFKRPGRVEGSYEIWEDLCPYPSSLWAYAGLAVDTESGKAVRRKKGVKSNWNPFLKTKLVGVLADCLIKANSDPWKGMYNDYKHRWKSAGKGNSDAHRHNAAKRYMVKMFLLALYKKWRELEGLPCRPPYAEEFIGKVHHGGPMAVQP